jgi:hypothetical protein
MPSEAAGVGAMLFLVMVIYRVGRPMDLRAIMRDGLCESGMLLMVICTSILFGYMLWSLQVTQSLAQAIGELQVNRWVVLAAINLLLLLVAGCLLPPAAIIPMTTPILMPCHRPSVDRSRSSADYRGYPSRRPERSEDRRIPAGPCPGHARGVCAREQASAGPGWTAPTGHPVLVSVGRDGIAIRTACS